MVNMKSPLADNSTVAIRQPEPMGWKSPIPNVVKVNPVK